MLNGLLGISKMLRNILRWHFLLVAPQFEFKLDGLLQAFETPCISYQHLLGSAYPRGPTSHPCLPPSAVFLETHRSPHQDYRPWSAWHCNICSLCQHRQSLLHHHLRIRSRTCQCQLLRITVALILVYCSWSESCIKSSSSIFG